MRKRYSIAEARHNFAAIVHELEAQPEIELTRRGVPVAVLLSLEAYHQLRGKPQSFWELYTAYRATFDPAGSTTRPTPSTVCAMRRQDARFSCEAALFARHERHVSRSLPMYAIWRRWY
jgi:prevent-host-death family protein